MPPHDSTKQPAGRACQLPCTYPAPHNIDVRSNVRTPRVFRPTRTCARVRCPAETDWRRWFQPPRVTTHPPPLLPLLPPILAVADRQNQQSTQLVSASRISQLFAPRRILGPSLGCKPNCAIPCFSELKTSLKKVVDRPTALQSQFQVYLKPDHTLSNPVLHWFTYI